MHGLLERFKGFYGDLKKVDLGQLDQIYREDAVLRTLFTRLGAYRLFIAIWKICALTWKPVDLSSLTSWKLRELPTLSGICISDIPVWGETYYGARDDPDTI